MRTRMSPGRFCASVTVPAGPPSSERSCVASAVRATSIGILEQPLAVGDETEPEARHAPDPGHHLRAAVGEHFPEQAAIDQAREHFDCVVAEAMVGWDEPVDLVVTEERVIDVHRRDRCQEAIG